MTLPLQVLAVGAVVAGFVGIPAALGGGNTIEKFLQPSFTAESVRLKPDATTVTAPTEAAGEPEEPHVSRGIALAMLFVGGLALGRYAGYGSWKVGLLMAGLGTALVLAINALGG